MTNEEIDKLPTLSERREARIKSKKPKYNDKGRSKFSYKLKKCGFKKVKCLECGVSGVKLYYHHIEPLKCGGLHIIENVTILCGKCHRKKHPELPSKLFQ